MERISYLFKWDLTPHSSCPAVSLSYIMVGFSRQAVGSHGARHEGRDMNFVFFYLSILWALLAISLEHSITLPQETEQSLSESPYFSLPCLELRDLANNEGKSTILWHLKYPEGQTCYQPKSSSSLSQRKISTQG